MLGAREWGLSLNPKHKPNARPVLPGLREGRDQRVAGTYLRLKRVKHRVIEHSMSSSGLHVTAWVHTYPLACVTSLVSFIYGYDCCS